MRIFVVFIKWDRQIREDEVGLYIYEYIVRTVQAVIVRHTGGNSETYIRRRGQKTPQQNCARAVQRLRGEDNIKLNPRELLCEDVDWIHMAVDRVKWWIFFKIWQRTLVQFVEQLYDYQFILTDSEMVLIIYGGQELSFETEKIHTDV